MATRSPILKMWMTRHQVFVLLGILIGIILLIYMRSWLVTTAGKVNQVELLSDAFAVYITKGGKRTQPLATAAGGPYDEAASPIQVAFMEEKYAVLSESASGSIIELFDATGAEGKRINLPRFSDSTYENVCLIENGTRAATVSIRNISVSDPLLRMRPSVLVLQSFLQSKAVERDLGPNRVFAISWSTGGKRLLCLAAALDEGVGNSAIILSGDDLGRFQTIPLPERVLTAGWLSSDTIYCVSIEGKDSIAFDAIQLKNVRRKRIQRWSIPSILGGRFVNSGPDGLDRFYIYSAVDVYGTGNPSAIDGYRVDLVFDVKRGTIYRLTQQKLDEGVFLARAPQDFVR